MVSRRDIFIAHLPYGPNIFERKCGHDRYFRAFPDAHDIHFGVIARLDRAIQ